MPFHGGLDWGGIAHAVCVVDAAGQVVTRIEARHHAAGLADMLARLRKIAPAAELPIAIERPSGLIVDALVEAGHPVVPIHPNVVKACRFRYRAAGGKSDPGAAYMLADILRADVTCFADNSRHASAWAAAIYAGARGRGCKHGHAVRILARAWVRVLWRAGQYGKSYDPKAHAGAAHHA